MASTKIVPIIAVVNNKGGDGKTFCSMSLAASAVKAGKKTLFFDGDPQGNASLKMLQYLLLERGEPVPNPYEPPMHPDYLNNPEDGWDGYSSYTNVFLGGELVTYPSSHPLLDVIPASSSQHNKLSEKLLNQNQAINPSLTMDDIHNFPRSKFTQELLRENGYDLVIIDNPPALEIVTKSSIRLATHVVIPIQLNSSSIQGLGATLVAIDEQNATKPRNEQTKIVGIYPQNVAYDNRKANAETLKSLRANPLYSKYLAPKPTHSERNSNVNNFISGGYDITDIFDKFSKDEKIHLNAKAFGKDVLGKVFEEDIKFDKEAANATL